MHPSNTNQKGEKSLQLVIVMIHTLIKAYYAVSEV